MEEGEIDDDRSLLPRSRPPVVRYRAPVNYGRQLDPHYHVRASRHHSPVGSPVGMPPMLPLEPACRGASHNIQSNMLRSNVIGRRLSQNEIRLMALQNMKSNNGSVLPQPRLTKRGSHINSFQPTKHLAPTRPTIQTVAHNNNIRSNGSSTTAKLHTNTLLHRQRFVHGQNRSRTSAEISHPLNQKQNSYGDNFQTAAQAAQVCLSGIKSTIRNEEIATTFWSFW